MKVMLNQPKRRFSVKEFRSVALSHFLHGDTLVEVMFAVGIIGLVAVGAISIMNKGLYTAQSTLETTMARSEIDTQAEALRFVHDAYISEIDSGINTYSVVWKEIMKHVYEPSDLPEDFYESYNNVADGSNEASCRDLYDDGQIPQRSFIINPRYLSSDAITELVQNDQLDKLILDSSNIFMPSTYPRLIYFNAGEDILSEFNPTDNLATRQNGIDSAEGIWVTVVSENLGDHRATENHIPEYYDFYIRTCWDTPSSSMSSVISTTIRLRNPEKTISEPEPEDEPEEPDAPTSCSDYGIAEMQNWTNSLSDTNPEIDLCDNRDLSIYRVRKLSDGRAWMIDNLKLDFSNLVQDISTENTNNPNASFLAQSNTNPEPVSGAEWCADNTNGCINSLAYNNENLSSEAFKAYGVYYNWYTATAGHGTRSMSEGHTPGDICPSGWRLPKGGNSSEENDFLILSEYIGGEAAFPNSFKSFPNLFNDTGYYGHGGAIFRGDLGYFWSSTATPNNANAYNLSLSSVLYNAGTYGNGKYFGNAVRCLLDYEPESYKLTYDANGGTNAPASQTKVAISGFATFTVSSDVPTRRYYDFKGWALSSSATKPTLHSRDSVSITKDTTLFAVWEPQSYQIIYRRNYNSADTVDTMRAAYVGVSTKTISLPSDWVRSGYTFKGWNTAADGSGTYYNVGDFVTDLGTPTRFGVLFAQWEEEPTTPQSYQIIYRRNYDSADTVNTMRAAYVGVSTTTIALPSGWTRAGYKFTGWNTAANGSGAHFGVGDSVTDLGTPIRYGVLFAQWEEMPQALACSADTHRPASSPCPAGKICYAANGRDVAGTMGNQSASSNAQTTLIASNYSVDGCGFAGWSTDPNANQHLSSSTMYGPNQTITTPDLSSSGLQLYATWVPSEGNMQGWNRCRSMSIGDVTALTDVRDNSTYAIAKLKDNECWMIENFRLNPNSIKTSLTDKNTNNPTVSFMNSGMNTANAITDKFFDNGCWQMANYRIQCYNKISYDISNITNRASNPSTADNNLYSYGVYYSRQAAVADHDQYEHNYGTYWAKDHWTYGDICPFDWKLPGGGTQWECNDDGNDYTRQDFSYCGIREYATLSNNIGAPRITSDISHLGPSTEVDAANNVYRSYPNNYVLSGQRGMRYGGNLTIGYVDRGVIQRGQQGYYHSNTGYPKGFAQTFLLIVGAPGAMYHYSGAGNGGIQNEDSTFDMDQFPQGNAIRCVYDPSYTLVYDAASISHENVREGDQITLYSPSMTKTGYGFAGWSLDPNADPSDPSAVIYGPNETISAPSSSYSTVRIVQGDYGIQYKQQDVVTLYAVWVPSAGDISSWNSCGSMRVGQITALTDNRLSYGITTPNTYAVAKLVDGKCWMIENDRYENRSDWNDSYWWDASEKATLYHSLNLRGRNNQPARNPLTNDGWDVWSSFGIIYNQKTANLSCAPGWHLPTGAEMTNIVNLAGSTASNKSITLRTFPNNFVLAGKWIKYSHQNRGTDGYYWSAEPANNLHLNVNTAENVTSGNGLAVRCISN